MSVIPSCKQLIIVTGATRGLGSALIDRVLQLENTQVVSLSRSIRDEHTGFLQSSLSYFSTDLAKPYEASSLKAVARETSENVKIYIILNAAVIMPLARIGEFEDGAIGNSIQTNVSYNVSLINHALNLFGNRELCFVNISTGASTKAIANWGLYCSAKAYMEMFFSVLRAENEGNKKYTFFSIDPGALDTEMQKDIRESNAPSKEYFANLMTTNKLKNPSEAAIEILTKIGLVL